MQATTFTNSGQVGDAQPDLWDMELKVDIGAASSDHDRACEAFAHLILGRD